MYLLGLDIGGTATKAALYTENGIETGVSSVSTDAITPFFGFVEIDMEAMWDACCFVIRDLLKKTGTDPNDIAAVAACGHGKGLYLWGKNNKPVRNGILSSDNRAYEYPLKWVNDGTAEKVFKLSYQSILACQPVSLLAWLQDNEPVSIENTEYIFECKDYIRFLLTGLAKAELTDYSGANLINLSSKNYDKTLLELFGLRDVFDKLPPLCHSTDIAGTISDAASLKTGLRAGTPVAGGMFDINACAVAVDAAHEDRVCMIAGTWSINEYIRKHPVLDGRVLLNSIFCIPEYYLIEESSPTSAANYEWFINTLLCEMKEQHKGDFYKEADRLILSVPENDFYPFFTPFLLGSNVHPNAKASFVGMSSFHERSHLLKSIYEGVAFSHKYHFEKLVLTRETKASCVRLAGGVARSDIWAQMFADILEYPVETVDVNETGALGTSMAAAIAIGKYTDFIDAAKAMTKTKKVFTPDSKNSRKYSLRYNAYIKILNSLDCVWDDIQKLID